MLISIFTGFAAGALHVIGGADHLVAMIPGALRRPGSAVKSGLEWGFGHSVGILSLSLIGILVKDFTSLQRMSSFAELVVGLSLLVIGTWAVRTSLGLNIHSHNHNHEDGNFHDHLHLHFHGKKKHSRHSHAVTSLGLLHGLAGGTHLIAVIPALALPPISAIAYMAAYLIGSISAMSAFVLVLSMATLRASQKALQILVGLTGGLSIAMGFFWLHKTSPLIL